MSNAPPETACLVADIGGTNARFALADLGGAAPALFDPRSYREADFGAVEDAIDRYLADVGGSIRPVCAVLAVAGPVASGAAQSTNGTWRLAEDALVAHGLGAVRVINDYTALALAVPGLQSEDMAAVGPDLEGSAQDSVVVLGAGTGFGAAALARGVGGVAATATEAGHAAFAPTDAVEIDILERLSERYGRVSIERILSGPGLIDLRWALGRIDGGDPEPIKAEQIVARANAGGDSLCAATLARFCAIYGAVAGDIALTLGARGGVYLGGGIGAGILDYLRASAFRERFEAKGRFAGYMSRIPTKVITHHYAALIGCGALGASIRAV